MKKKILFVIDSLACAGAEKSLLTLLGVIDYSKYDVDLQLFSYEGELQSLLPEQVNLLPELEYTKFTALSMKNAVLYTFKKCNFLKLFARMKFSWKVRRCDSTNAKKAILWWESVKNCINKSAKYYDVAISYAQGIPTYYVIDKIEAQKKYAWINVSLHLDDKDISYQSAYYEKYVNIVAVSHVARESVTEKFPQFIEKIKIIYDINDYDLIYKLSKVGDNPFKDDKKKMIKLLTVGRLTNQKGYDIALEACKILKKRNVNFKWFVLGKGELQESIEAEIKDNDLQSYFELLGVVSNPYPYIANCDIYVQPSKFEGFGLAIAEARMLNKPVVTTKFDAVFNQMVQEKNGLVVEMNAQAVADGIDRMLTDKVLKSNIIQYLEHEKKGNVEELEKFYELIED